MRVTSTPTFNHAVHLYVFKIIPAFQHSSMFPKSPASFPERTPFQQAAAPPGYIMVEACPPLETRRQKRSLVGKLILYGWEADDCTGWFVGRVARNRVTTRDRRGVPTANYIVRYTAKQTNGKINGLVACELSVRTYGHSQWWVLLQRSGADLCHSSALGRSDSSDGEQLALL